MRRCFNYAALKFSCLLRHSRPSRLTQSKLLSKSFSSLISLMVLEFSSSSNKRIHRSFSHKRENFINFFDSKILLFICDANKKQTKIIMEMICIRLSVPHLASSSMHVLFVHVNGMDFILIMVVSLRITIFIDFLFDVFDFTDCSIYCFLDSIW